MTADLPPLSDEERAQFGRVARLLQSTCGLDGCGGWSTAFLRMAAERDALAARVSSLEAEAQYGSLAGADAELDGLREKAQEVRRAWDRREEDLRHGNAYTATAYLGRAIDALCPPLESPGAPKEDA